MTSFFTDPDLPAPNFGDLRFDDPANADVNVFAYTYSFGNGFSATLSLENGLQRRVNNTLVFPLFGVDAAVPVFAPIPFTYAGDRSPTSSPTCATHPIGAACSFPARCIRSATWRPASPPSTA